MANLKISLSKKILKTLVFLKANNTYSISEIENANNGKLWRMKNVSLSANRERGLQID